MNTIAILQARLGSTRFPDKILADVAGKTMLERVVERVKSSSKISEVVIATTDRPSDLKVFDYCKTLGVRCFAGPEDDVLKRYVMTAQKLEADAIVRVTSDCPLFDGAVLDEGLTQFQAGGYDYVTNVLPPTYPDGLDFSIFKTSVLFEADQEATLPSEREHVVPWMWKMCTLKGGTRYRAKNLEADADYSAHRWTVDHHEDLLLVQAIYKNFRDGNFSWKQVLQFLAMHPELSETNGSIIRDEGYLKSLKQDQEKK